MTHKIISIILSAIFITFIASPTVCIMLDNSIDVAFVFSLNEEEEKSTEETSNLKIVLQNQFNILEPLNEVSPKFNFFDNYWLYTNPLQTIISPPPELI